MIELKLYYDIIATYITPVNMFINTIFVTASEEKISKLTTDETFWSYRFHVSNNIVIVVIPDCILSHRKFVIHYNLVTYNMSATICRSFRYSNYGYKL